MGYTKTFLNNTSIMYKKMDALESSVSTSQPNGSFVWVAHLYPGPPGATTEAIVNTNRRYTHA